MVGGEARGHRLRRRQHVAEVAAPQRLGGVERRVVADRDERVLQRRAGARVRVDVAGRDGPQLELARERGEAAVARAVVAQVGALQLDAQAVGREGVAQLRSVARSWTPSVAQPLRQTRPSAWSRSAASETWGCVAWRRRTPGAGPPPAPGPPVRSSRLLPARVSVRAGEEPAEVAPPALVLDEQRQVAAVVERQLGAVQRPQARPPCTPARAPSRRRRCRGRSARAPRAPARQPRPPARPAARRRRGTRRRNARAAPHRTRTHVRFPHLCWLPSGGGIAAVAAPRARLSLHEPAATAQVVEDDDVAAAGR